MKLNAIPRINGIKINITEKLSGRELNKRPVETKGKYCKLVIGRKETELMKWQREYACRQVKDAEKQTSRQENMQVKFQTDMT